MKYCLNVENIKCGGCANSIGLGLKKLKNVQKVTVDIEAGLITINYKDKLNKEKVVKALADMGYPEVNSVSGLKSLKSKAVSFVSCAIGRVKK